MSQIEDWYKKDLAYIHDVGFGDFAFKSAAAIVEILQTNNLECGLIIDLGCGGGLSAREFIDANYRVLGIDISAAAVAIAKKRVPEAEFKIESLFKAKIPPCIAVTSIGECLNYLFDPENNLQILTILFDRIYRALLPGGILIFDLLQPHATKKTQGFKEGEDWLIFYEKEENCQQKLLTRRITTFRKQGNYYRRDDETHRACLYEVAEIIDRLSQVGFQVQTQNNYGDFYLSPSHTVFIAQK